MLRDIDDGYGKAAVVQLCGIGEYPPTISQIRELALDISEGRVTPPSPWEAWENVRRYVSKSGENWLGGYHEQEPEVVLSDIESRALETIGGTYAVKHSENIGVDRSNFVRAYADFLKTDRRMRLAVPEVRRLAESSDPVVTPLDRRISEPKSQYQWIDPSHAD